MAKAKNKSKKTKELTETLRVGQPVRITKKGDAPDGHNYEGAYGSIVRVKYTDEKELVKATSGDPALARFAKADIYYVRTRGGRHARLSLKPSEVEPVSQQVRTRESV